MNTHCNLSTRGYTILKEKLLPSELQQIKKDLTVQAFVNKDFQTPPPPFPVYGESQRKIYIPRFYGIEKYGQPYTSKLNTPSTIECKFTKELRPIQLPIVDAFIKAATSHPYGGGGIISVPCGYGKTVLALYLICVLKVKTLVVVHKEFLLNQWKERIEQFVTDARIGVVQGQKCKVKDKDIVLGMLQSLSMKDYNPDVFEDFGFVIYDECHHLGAEVFSKALLKTNFKYLLGLSATPKRLDGLSKVFEWYLGPMVYVIKKRVEETVSVKVIKYTNENEEYSKEKLNQMGKPMMPGMINNITTFEPRTNLIIEEIKVYLEEGRKILVLSDRRDHLKVIKEKTDEINPEKYKSGFYLGGMKPEDLEVTEEADVILGTFSMASEGFDCKYPLNTIILASPKSNIEQAVGRILRQEAKYRKFVPLVVDIWDNFSLFARQGKKRIDFYKKNKYTIDYYDEMNQFVETKDYSNPDKEPKKKKEKEESSFIDEDDD
jgi:superfamily II DNA or RNA helicase